MNQFTYCKICLKRDMKGNVNKCILYEHSKYNMTYNSLIRIFPSSFNTLPDFSSFLYYHFKYSYKLHQKINKAGISRLYQSICRVLGEGVNLHGFFRESPRKIKLMTRWAIGRNLAKRRYSAIGFYRLFYHAAKLMWLDHIDTHSSICIYDHISSSFNNSLSGDFYYNSIYYLSNKMILNHYLQL